MKYNLNDMLRKVVAYYKRKHKNVKNDFWLWFEIVTIFINITLNLQGIRTLSKIMNKKMSCIGTTISIYY